ncbi:MAG TPA: hypothetical protein V6C58_24865 [Allocoleopsis sp.]
MSIESKEYQILVSFMYKFNNLKIFLFSAFLVLISFFIYRNINVGLADESFLWYGTIHTTLGEVPLRDFQSYDPARYYWGAIWFKIFNNDGLMTLRASFAMLEVLGLTFALLSLQRVIKSWFVLYFVGILISFWMYVHYKSSDTVTAIAAVYFAVLLIDKPSLIRHFLIGIFVGFSAFIGRNHGVYNLFSFSFLIIFIWFKFSRELLLKRFFFWSLGIVIGYSPMILMYILIPGLFEASLNNIKTIIQSGSNLKIPIAWPWSFNYLNSTPIEGLRYFSNTIYFLIYPLFNILSLIYLLWTNSESLKRNYLFIATTFICLTYIHYAFDRADLIHLSFVIVPLIMALISIPINSKLSVNVAKSIRIIILAFIFLTTIVSMGVYSPINQVKILFNSSYIPQNIKGDLLYLDAENYKLIRTLQKINHQLIKPTDEILVASPLSGIYILLDKKSPIWDLYPVFSLSKERQKNIINQINEKKVKWIIINNNPLDDLEERRFSNLNPLLWNYFIENFEIIKNSGLTNGNEIMQRKVNQK